MIKVSEPIKRLFEFIQERQLIFMRRAAGEKKPWTKDPILQRFRFCNVYRENDAVTRWIATNWRAPHSKDRHLWFAMAVARIFNLPSTLEQLGWPIPWHTGAMRLKLKGIQRTNDTVFNAAYIISTNGISMDKIEYVVERVLTPLWAKREDVAALIFNETLGTLPPPTLQNIHARLTQFNGLGSFLAAQIIADLKYVQPYASMADWHTFAASGPGSRRGMNRVVGLDIHAPWTEREWHNNLLELREKINALRLRKRFGTARDEYGPLHAQDLQNCLCEFDKYERARLGQGRPKQKFQGV